MVDEKQAEQLPEAIFLENECKVFEGHMCNCQGECEKLEESKKIVYCRDYLCIWNMPIKDAKGIKHNRTYVPLGKDSSSYKGICGRKEIAVSPKDYVTGSLTTSVHYEVATCDMRSPSRIKGHIDMTHISGGTFTENLTDV